MWVLGWVCVELEPSMEAPVFWVGEEFFEWFTWFVSAGCSKRRKEWSCSLETTLLGTILSKILHFISGIKTETTHGESTYFHQHLERFGSSKSGVLVWFAILDRLCTKDRLKKMNILDGDNLRCVFRGIMDETSEHLFIHCMFSWKTWCMCLSWGGINWITAADLKSQFESWLEADIKGIEKKCWGCLFYVIIWSVWKYRNKIIFEGEAVNWEVLWWQHWCEQWCKESRCARGIS